MAKDSSDLLKAKKTHLEDFLVQTKRANDIIPKVKQALELTDWNLDIVKKAPIQVRHAFETASIKKVLESDLKIWQESLPVNPINPYSVNTLASGASGTASEIVFNTVLGASTINQPEVKSWVQNSQNQYFKIQEKQDREGETYAKLLLLNQPLAEEFKLASENYKKTLADVLLPESSANSMRNVLNHFIGNLIEKARKTPKENAGSNLNSQWTFVSNRLTQPGSPENFLLKGKSNNHRDLVSSLTNISKNTSKNALVDLKNIYTRWLDHLYTSIQLAGY